MIKIKTLNELKNDKGLLKKCEICHEGAAVKSKITFAGKKIHLCKKCFKIIEF